MVSVWWLLLLGTTVSHMVHTQEQPLLEEDTAPIDDLDVLEKAKGILIRSILEGFQEEQQNNRDLPDAMEMISKRQHPGKRFQEEIEKRQHPGKRDLEDLNLELSKRQHPGRRFVDDVEKRQHPGKREEGDWSRRYLTDNSRYLDLLSDVSKRQHPGKRVPAPLFTKRQHPGKREAEEEGDTEFENSKEVGKRQHPGKRYDPCEGPNAYNCNSGNILPDSVEELSFGL
uniref:Pro-thyrotropin-releasing hormone n=1 Tax=Xenopus laevis TaxID=8355 RepID=A2RV77_XENLA|nr:Unknown (protein for MGC:160757) [Xenopus laevis]